MQNMGFFVLFRLLIIIGNQFYWGLFWSFHPSCSARISPLFLFLKNDSGTFAYSASFKIETFSLILETVGFASTTLLPTYIPRTAATISDFFAHLNSVGSSFRKCKVVGWVPYLYYLDCSQSSVVVAYKIYVGQAFLLWVVFYPLKTF